MFEGKVVTFLRINLSVVSLLIPFFQRLIGKLIKACKTRKMVGNNFSTGHFLANRTKYRTVTLHTLILVFMHEPPGIYLRGGRLKQRLHRDFEVGI